MATLYEALTGNKWPKDVAYIISDGPNRLRRVTWEEIKAERIKTQRERLKRILAVDALNRQAAYVWAFFVPGVIYGGWHLYLRTIRDSFWISRDVHRRDLGRFDDLALDVMAKFPCGFLPLRDNFRDWLPVFATTYQSQRKRGGKPQGIIFGWAEMEHHASSPCNFTPAGHR